MVTSAAVPAVVGTATIGTDLFFVAATPSKDFTSANSGLLVTTPIALAVSIADPPPMAKRKSALDATNAFTPVSTFSMVGLGFTLS